METKRIAGIILAAGKGTRMHSHRPKVMQELLGVPMIWYVHAAVSKVVGETLVVTGHGAPEVEGVVLDGSPHYVRQTAQLGTGHALQSVWPHIGSAQWCLVVNGDTPLITSGDLNRLLVLAQKADLAFLTMELDNPSGYGRVVRNRDGSVERIVEDKDFDPHTHGFPTGEVNAGHYLLNVDRIGPLLCRLDNLNRQKEYYITQLIDLAIGQGLRVEAVKGDSSSHLLGVNNPRELVHTEEVLRRQIVSSWIEQGVLIRNPGAVRIGPQVILEPGSEITGPCEIYGASRISAGTTIDSHCWIMATILQPGAHIRSFSHVEKAEVGTGCIVGPFARLRPGAIMKDDARVGNFVEVKSSILGKGSKAGHLTYLGDSEIGEGVNIGAGTITCNYDGARKHKTVIGDESFIGSNTALVAPVSVGKRSVVGAGSTITKDVGEDILVVARSKQKQYPKKG
jgi:bifunctional UDP-N-acetylglucosamine pyrophosphorylase / glucosamine-1-phosphate N-acetyltransferase